MFLHRRDLHRLPAQILEAFHHLPQPVEFLPCVHQPHLAQIEPRLDALQLHDHVPVVLVRRRLVVVRIFRVARGLPYGKVPPDVHLQVLEKLVALHVELLDRHLVDEERRVLLLHVALVHVENLLLRVALNVLQKARLLATLGRHPALVELPVDQLHVQLGQFLDEGAFRSFRIGNQLFVLLFDGHQLLQLFLALRQITVHVVQNVWIFRT
uniref:(northern house mosquito) hypothetical protein n=1 Tax=Culex pipiens TaxID=7175 RepID=A0A8D8N2N9_CULPI